MGRWMDWSKAQASCMAKQVGGRGPAVSPDMTLARSVALPVSLDKVMWPRAFLLSVTLGCQVCPSIKVKVVMVHMLDACV